MNQHKKGLLITLVGALLLTPDTMFIRLINADGLVLAFWRGLMIGIVFLIGSYLSNPKNFMPNIYKAGWVGFFMTITFGISSFMFILATVYTSIANLLVILALIPLGTAIFSWILLKERLAISTLITIIACFIGILIVFKDGLETANNGLGELFALGAASMLALNLTLVRMRPDINILPFNGLGGLLLPLCVWPFVPSLMMETGQFGLTFVLCAIIIPISFYLILEGPRYITSSEVGLIMLIETVLGPYWVWLAIGEEPSFSTAIGGTIVIISILLHSIWSLKHSHNRA